MNTEQTVLTAKIIGECGQRDPITTLISIEIFSFATMGLGSGAKVSTSQFPDLLLPPAQLNNLILHVYFCMVTLHEGYKKKQTTSNLS